MNGKCELSWGKKGGEGKIPHEREANVTNELGPEGKKFEMRRRRKLLPRGISAFLQGNQRNEICSDRKCEKKLSGFFLRPVLSSFRCRKFSRRI